MNHNSGIYCIRNLVNDNRYIGQSFHMTYRMGRHKNALTKGVHPNKHLQSAFSKYGKDNFIFEILERCSISKLTKREQYWIDKLKPKYNKAPAAGSMIGYKFTPEQREKVSAAARGRKLSEEWKMNVSIGNKGRHLSKEHKKKISLSRAKIKFPNGYKKRK